MSKETKKKEGKKQQSGMNVSVEVYDEQGGVVTSFDCGTDVNKARQISATMQFIDSMSHEDISKIMAHIAADTPMSEVDPQTLANLEKMRKTMND